MFLRCGDNDLTELERQSLETNRADRSLFVQELLLSSLAEGLRLDDDLVNSRLESDLGILVQNIKEHRSDDSVEPSDDCNDTLSSTCDIPSNRHHNVAKHKEGHQKSEKEPPPPSMSH